MYIMTHIVLILVLHKIFVTDIPWKDGFHHVIIIVGHALPAFDAETRTASIMDWIRHGLPHVGGLRNGSQNLGGVQENSNGKQWSITK